MSFGTDAAGGSSLDEHSAGHGAAKDSPSSHDDHGGGHGHHDGPPPGPIMKAMHFAQSYSLPLLLGIVAALIWANIAPESYHNVLGHGHDTWQPFPNFLPFGHALNIHYCINDIFMVFFGIAAKEWVAESALPGGSLNPPRKALAPLVATLGGVGGPGGNLHADLLYLLQRADGGAFSSYTKFVPSANASSSSSAAHRMLGASDYFGASGAVSGGIFGMSSSALLSSSSSSDDAFTWREQQQQWAHRDRMRWLQSIDDPSQLSDSHNRMLASAAVDYSAGTYERIELGDIIYGWGVPTATDISLAWVVAVQVFPFRHPAIDFLLLLAVADDAIGLVIIAIAYKDENYPTEWVYLLVCVAATLITLPPQNCTIAALGVVYYTRGHPELDRPLKGALTRRSPSSLSCPSCRRRRQTHGQTRYQRTRVRARHQDAGRLWSLPLHLCERGRAALGRRWSISPRSSPRWSSESCSA